MASPELQPQLVEQLLGSVLQTIVRAQGLMSSQVAELVEKVGFEETSDGKLEARTFSFSFLRSEVDGVTGQVVQRQVTATMPVLGLINLPSLTIAEADISLDIRLVAQAPAATQGGRIAAGRAAERGAFSALPNPLRLFGVLAPKRVVRGKDEPVVVESSGTMRVTLKLRSQETPLGLDKLLSVLDTSHHEA
ncbi:MAG: DUF2589 domain-containing protein [Pirellulaceae bacterium]|nr:DUF2589 domain-containing protein [Pirellulaceae bacterium]